MSRLSPQEEIVLLRKKARRRLVGAVALVAIAIAVLWNTLGKTPQQVHPEQIAVVPETASSSVGQPTAPAGQPPLTIQEPERHQTSEPVASAPAAQPPAPRDTSADAAQEKAAQEKAKKEKAAKEKEEKRLAAEKARKEKEKKKAAEKAQETQPHTQPPKPAEKPAKPKKPEADPDAILNGRADAGDKAGQSAKPAANNTPSRSVMIQLAALTDQNKIDMMKSKLSQLGLNARYSKVQTSKGEATRVRIGPFASRAEADAAMSKLSRAGLSGIVVS